MAWGKKRDFHMYISEFELKSINKGWNKESDGLERSMCTIKEEVEDREGGG